MAFGITAISCCVGYLAYMKHKHKEQGLYTAIDDNDQMYLTKKRSKWDQLFVIFGAQLEDFAEWEMSQLIPPVVLKASKKHTGNNS